MRASDLKPGQRFKLATDKRILTAVAFDATRYAVMAAAGYDGGRFAVDDDHNLVPLHPDSYCELIAEKPASKSLPFTIVHHADDRKVHHGRVDVSTAGIEVFIDGYGTHDAAPEHGAPLFIEVDDNGHPVLHAWAEIDSQDPTHKVNLASARDTRLAE